MRTEKNFAAGRNLSVVVRRQASRWDARLLHEDLPPAEDRTLPSVLLPSLKISSYPPIFQSHPATKRSARYTNFAKYQNISWDLANRKIPQARCEPTALWPHSHFSAACSLL